MHIEGREDAPASSVIITFSIDIHYLSPVNSHFFLDLMAQSNFQLA